MAENGQKTIASEDWGAPLPPEEPEPVEEELELTQEQIQTGALLFIARSFDRIAAAIEKWTSQS